MNTSERLARTIAAEILDSGVAGANLATEPEISDRYGVGRSTVREALRLLESWGVVRVKRGRNGGTIATKPRLTDLATHMGIMMQFDGALLIEVFDARAVLDDLVARRAAEMITDDQVAALGDALDALGGAVDEHEAFFASNARFYQLLLEACGNHVLTLLLGAFREITHDTVRRLSYPRLWRETVLTIRTELFDAVSAHSPERASRAMRSYREETRRFWLAEYPELFRGRIDVIAAHEQPRAGSPRTATDTVSIG